MDSRCIGNSQGGRVISPQIFIVCPNQQTPSGGMGVLFRFAITLQELGYRTTVVVWDLRSDSFSLPWLDFDISNLDILSENNARKSLLNSRQEDFFIVAECLGQVMNKYSKINAKKIVLAQSWSYVYENIEKGFWNDLGFDIAICVSDFIFHFLKNHKNFVNLFQYKPSISTSFYSLDSKQKLKDIFIHCRGKETKVLAEFVVAHARRIISSLGISASMSCTYAEHIPRKEFAKELRTHKICLFTDLLAGLGTLPLEAFQSHTFCIGMHVPGAKEYQIPELGDWLVPFDPIGLAECLAKRYIEMVNEKFDWQSYGKVCDAFVTKHSLQQEKISIEQIFLKLV